MNLKKLLFPLAASLLLVAGCSKTPVDPAPEDANDNFITSLKLTVGGTDYSATIENNDITVTIPYNVSLDGAKVEFTKTASATVMPDPATITDWGTERQFRVTSYNGKTNDYKYLIVKDEIRAEGDVTLKTDAEVAAFAEKGVTIIKGNLTIGEANGENEVKSIAALSMLKEIEGTVTIAGTYKGADLTGLDNVTKMGGLQIGTPEATSTAPAIYFVKLAALAEVTGDVVVCNDRVEWIEAKQLTTIGGAFTARSAALTSFDLPVLATIGVGATIEGSNDGKAGGEMTIVELTELATVGGELLIQNLAKLSAVKLPKLTKAGAVLLPTIPYDFATLELPALNEVEGDLQLTSNTGHIIGGQLTNTGVRTLGLESLKTVGGTITISKLTELTSLPFSGKSLTIGGLELVGLKKYNEELDLSKFTFKSGGKVYLWLLDAITTLVGPTQADIELVLEVNDRLAEVKGFERLGTLNCRPSGNHTLTFSSLKSVTGNVTLNNYSVNPTVSAPGLETIGGNIEISIAKTVMPALRDIGGYFYLHDEIDLLDMPELKRVGGQFRNIAIANAEPWIFSLPKLEEVGTATNPVYYEVEGTDLDQKFVRGAFDMKADNWDAIKFPKLRKIGDKGFRIVFGYDPYMVALSLPALENVAGFFEVVNAATSNVTLETIELPAIKKIGSVAIIDIQPLSDFSMFAPVVSTVTSWRVEGCGYNPTLQDMKDGKYKPQ
jgi:hypothetical protein